MLILEKGSNHCALGNEVIQRYQYVILKYQFYFQSITSSTISSQQGKTRLVDVVVSINQSSDLLQSEDGSKKNGKPLSLYFNLILLH